MIPHPNRDGRMYCAGARSSEAEGAMALAPPGVPPGRAMMRALMGFKRASWVIAREETGRRTRR